MPLAWRLASGIAWTLALKTRPRLVKNSAQSWVLATSRCSTASSSRVTCADDALAAAMLAAVGGDRLALDVAAAGDRDHDVLVGDEVLVGHLAAGVVGDARPALAGVLALQLGQLVLDDLADPGRVGQDVLELGDELDDREVLVLDLLALERGQAARAACRGWPAPGARTGRSALIRLLRASSTSCDSRMVLMTASRLSRAILRPSRMCARARALPRSNSVRRRMISRRWSMWC